MLDFYSKQLCNKQDNVQLDTLPQNYLNEGRASPSQDLFLNNDLLAVHHPLIVICFKEIYQHQPIRFEISSELWDKTNWQADVKY